MADDPREIDAFLEAEASRVPVITGRNVSYVDNPRSLGPIYPGGPTGFYTEEQPFEPDTTEADLYARAMAGDRVAAARLQTMLDAYEGQGEMADALSPLGYIAASMAPVTGTAISMKNLPAAMKMSQLADIDPEAGVLEKAGAKGNALLEAIGAIPGGKIPKIIGTVIGGEHFYRMLSKLRPEKQRGYGEILRKAKLWKERLRKADPSNRADVEAEVVEDIRKVWKPTGVFTYPYGDMRPKMEIPDRVKLKKSFQQIVDEHIPGSPPLKLGDVIENAPLFRFVPEARDTLVQPMPLGMYLSNPDAVAMYTKNPPTISTPLFPQKLQFDYGPRFMGRGPKHYTDEQVIVHETQHDLANRSGVDPYISSQNPALEYDAKVYDYLDNIIVEAHDAYRRSKFKGSFEEFIEQIIGGDPERMDAYLKLRAQLNDWARSQGLPPFEDMVGTSPYLHQVSEQETNMSALRAGFPEERYRDVFPLDDMPATGGVGLLNPEAALKYTPMFDEKAALQQPILSIEDTMLRQGFPSGLPQPLQPQPARDLSKGFKLLPGGRKAQSMIAAYEKDLDTLSPQIFDTLDQWKKYDDRTEKLEKLGWGELKNQEAAQDATAKKLISELTRHKQAEDEVKRLSGGVLEPIPPEPFDYFDMDAQVEYLSEVLDIPPEEVMGHGYVAGEIIPGNLFK